LQKQLDVEKNKNEELRKEYKTLEVSKASEVKKQSVVASAATPLVNKTPSRSSSTRTKWIVYSATAYTATCRGCSGVTATGVNVKDQSKDYRIIAVDPRVIPLGSLVEVEGYGHFTAQDTGGAIKGFKIDILKQSVNQASEFGRKNVKLRVLRSGGS
jgi:3D (Asp-Asp-Asp) domain-containing protein